MPAATARPAWRRRHETWFFAGFTLAASVFVAMAITTLTNINTFSGSVRAVDQTRGVIANLDGLLLALTALESRQRDYLLTGDPEFLMRYTDMMADVDEQLKGLDARSGGSATLRTALPALKSMVAAREKYLLEVALREVSGHISLPILQKGIAQSDAISAAIARVRQAENRSLAARTAEVEAQAARNQGVILYGNAIALVLLLLAGSMFVRSSRQRACIEAERDRFFTLSLDLLCIAGMDGYFKRLNPAFNELLGWTMEEMLARPFLDFIHPDDRAASLAELEKLAAGAQSIDFENRYQCKDGTWKWLRWRARPVSSEKLLYAVARDVTAQKEHTARLAEASDAARAASQAKSTFLATMSHEIRTPLIGVLGMLEVLGRSELKGEQRRQLNIAHQSARSLLTIIGEILDFSKIEAGKMEAAPATISLRERISRVVGNFSAAAESKGLTLILDYDPAAAAAHVVDGTLLGQIVGNWVSNAIKFTERGAVTVSVRVAGQAGPAQALEISVADTGIGIPAEQLDKLFEPFTQADVSTTRRYGGTGLGLAISLRLATLIGAKVHADSTPGRGTTMSLRVTLPTGNPADIEKDAVDAVAADAVASRPLPTREQAVREGSLVLLAEDHPVNQMVLTQMLNLVGLQVEIASDGQQALEKFAAGRYGIVFTDLHMPGLDGYQLAAAIRQHERGNGGGRTPVVALTANVQREEVEKCLAAGMDDFLSKPVTIQQLGKAVQQWLPGPVWKMGAQAAHPIEPAALQELESRGAGNARDLLRLFCEVTSRDFAVLAAGAGQRDAAIVRRAAHSIKGAAGMVGAQELAAAAARLEAAALSGLPEDLGALTGALREAFVRVEKHVAAL